MWGRLFILSTSCFLALQGVPSSTGVFLTPRARTKHVPSTRWFSELEQHGTIQPLGTSSALAGGILVSVPSVDTRNAGRAGQHVYMHPDTTPCPSASRLS